MSARRSIRAPRGAAERSSRIPRPRTSSSSRGSACATARQKPSPASTFAWRAERSSPSSARTGRAKRRRSRSSKAFASNRRRHSEAGLTDAPVSSGSIGAHHRQLVARFGVLACAPGGKMDAPWTHRGRADNLQCQRQTKTRRFQRVLEWAVLGSNQWTNTAPSRFLTQFPCPEKGLSHGHRPPPWEG